MSGEGSLTEADQAVKGALAAAADKADEAVLDATRAALHSRPSQAGALQSGGR